MQAIPLRLKGHLLIQPNVFRDERGFFIESFQKTRYEELGIDCDFVQDNHSYSSKRCLRGMHYQSIPGQAKLVRVSRGEIFDVAVDIRPDSPTYGEWEGVFLDGENHHQLFIPIGFAHGFCVLSEEGADVCYKVSSSYCAETEKGFRWDDPTIGIDWPIHDPMVSTRDQSNPWFADMEQPVLMGGK